MTEDEREYEYAVDDGPDGTVYGHLRREVGPWEPYTPRPCTCGGNHGQACGSVETDD